jgi:hypothetical protein
METLLDLQLIPAAVINLRWREAQMGSGLGWYLRDELLNHADSKVLCNFYTQHKNIYVYHSNLPNTQNKNQARTCDKSVTYPVGEQLLANGGCGSSEVQSREPAGAVAEGKGGGVKGTTPKLFNKLFGKK